MNITAQQISQLLGGTVVGNPHAAVSAFAKIEEADATDLSFVANAKYAHHLHTTQAGILLVSQSLLAQQATAQLQPTLIVVADAYSALAQLMQWYAAQQSVQPTSEQPHFVHPSASIGEGCYIGAFSYIGANAVIGKGVQIYPHAYIGEQVHIGDHTIIYPQVSIYAHCKVGSHCILHAGAVVGSDGFGFAPQADGSYQKIPQIGNVVIANNVEVGANTCIDRATMGSTQIHAGTKLDNLIQIAHNVELGENTVIAAQTGIAGSTKLGKNCLVGGQVGFVGHISIADGTKINAQSGIAKPITVPNLAWSGTPAIAYRDWLRTSLLQQQLPQMEQRIQQLEKIIQQLTQPDPAQ